MIELDSTTLWDSGTYAYDGARNIVEIGTDEYWYDRAGRLQRAYVKSNLHTGGLTLDYSYDEFGNMLARDTEDQNTHDPEADTLHFTGRSYDLTGGVVNNRIDGTGFDYDANGNMITQPETAGLTGYRYRFNLENRMKYVQAYDTGSTGWEGSILQRAEYDSSGNRWLRVVKSDQGGVARITLRDVSGQVVQDRTMTSATEGLGKGTQEKQYIRANGQLVAILSNCGPPPLLSLGTAQASDEVRLHVDIPYGQTVDGDYTIYIEDDTGSYVTETKLDSEGPDFDFDHSEFGSGIYKVRVKGTYECGETGYSNAVSFVKSSPSCLTDTTVFHTSFWPSYTSYPNATLNVLGNDQACSGSLEYNLYHVPEGTGTPQLVADELSSASYSAAYTSIGAGLGTYYFVEYDPSTQTEGASATATELLEEDPLTGSAGLPGVSSWRTTYVHWDHLGSTRALTDEMGLVVATYKYYPFGTMAEQTGGADTRMKFTGHERDEGIGLDYMRARYTTPTLARFLGVDPIAGFLASPQTMHRYAYVRNSPIVLIDPDGREFKNRAVDDAIRTRADALGNTFIIQTLFGGVLDLIVVSVPKGGVDTGTAETDVTQLEYGRVIIRVEEGAGDHAVDHEFGHAWLYVVFESIYVHGLDPDDEPKADRAGNRLAELASGKKAQGTETSDESEGDGEDDGQGSSPDGQEDKSGSSTEPRGPSDPYAAERQAFGGARDW